MTENPLRPLRRAPQSTSPWGWFVRVHHVLTPLCIITVLVCLITAMATPAWAAPGEEHLKQTGAQIVLKASSPLVTDKSGYSLRVSVTNTQSQDLVDTLLSVDTNALYSFSSRIDMQSWSEGRTHIPTEDNLDSKPLDPLQPGKSIDVSLGLPADCDSLKKMTTWGPKPVRISLTGKNGQVITQTYTFLTRTWDGLPNANTPPLSMTMVIPLTTTEWVVNEKNMSKLMTQNDATTAQSSPSDASKQVESTSPSPSASPKNQQTQPQQKEETNPAENGNDSNQSQVISLGHQASKNQESQRQLLDRHPSLQALADPTYLSVLTEKPRINGLIQAGDFDISTYAGQDQNRYTKAGVTPDAWSAKTSSALYTSSNPNQDQSLADHLYAWQGLREWGMDSITAARKAGYTRVIAPLGFEAGAGASAHTGKYTVSTQSGQVTVLSAQRELSSLAQGSPSTSKASGEQTGAGRVARFLAQSAFYQMEQPYAQRDLMVCFGANQDTQEAEQIMNLLEHAPWISLGSLQTVEEATDNSAETLKFQGGKEDDKETSKQDSTISSTLDSLTASRQDIIRFSTSILAHSPSAQSTSKTPGGKSDSQALARQDADTTARQSDDPKNWLDRITKAHDCLALHALAGIQSAPAVSDQARAISDQLLDGIQITPSESLTVISETASMPVTVSNNHPYPVHARISARTNSTEIVTSRTADTVIPAHSEAQVTFKVRVATAGKADVTISLIDQDGQPFGQTGTAHITSNLRLSDMSGLIFVLIAVLLGLVGLWRQFHRTKDPDE